LDLATFPSFYASASNPEVLSKFNLIHAQSSTEIANFISVKKAVRVAIGIGKSTRELPTLAVQDRLMVAAIAPDSGDSHLKLFVVSGSCQSDGLNYKVSHGALRASLNSSWHNRYFS
jgi:hypothetical protein